MITINNEPIKAAIEAELEQKGSKDKVAAHADTTAFTIDRIVEGSSDMNLSTLDKVASHFGFITEVNFVPAKR